MDTSYRKQIHDYLDGALSEEEERQLFDNLSANPAWRQELTAQMRMHEAMQKDIASVTIPAKATASVFSALGFNVPQKAAAFMGNKFLQSGMQKLLFGFGSLAVIGIASFFIKNSHENQITQQIVVKNTAETRNNTVSNLISPVGNPRPILTKNIPSNSSSNKSSQDIGKFSSLDYLSKTKVIGITSGGNIYLSDDGGSLWAQMRSNTSKDLYGLHFTDASHGVVVGAEGTILLTANAGKDWMNVASGTTANLIAVHYITTDTIYACGAQGTILRSTTGGLIWQKLESGTTASLYSIHFENSANGIIRGEHGVTLKTINGGASWFINN